ncbi:unnamed protein product [Leptidea sinapis]|uniref:Uncharacterized protein n=1 Tax=Leptidea sinapis TaxID=189913 RepID=A0A5E4Q7D1_9NEOP|nr:unnamed protein product [Leptidea sinapis]
MPRDQRPIVAVENITSVLKFISATASAAVTRRV